MIKSMVCGGGGIEVQTTSGSVTTSNSGTATINCGFRPDLVVIYMGSGGGYETVAAFPIKERKTSSTLNTVSWNGSSSEDIVDFDMTGVSDTGCSLRATVYGASGSTGSLSRRSLSWRAVKYTE